MDLSSKRSLRNDKPWQGWKEDLLNPDLYGEGAPYRPCMKAHITSYLFVLCLEYLPYEGQMSYFIQIYRKDQTLLCHYRTTYCIRYQGEWVIVRLFCIIHFSVISFNILKIIAIATRHCAIEKIEIPNPKKANYSPKA